MGQYNINIDGKKWDASGKDADHEAIHAVAGAIMAGADSIEIEKVEERL